MRLWRKKKTQAQAWQGSAVLNERRTWNPSPITVSKVTAHSFADFRADLVARSADMNPASTTYFVDGNAVADRAAMLASLNDGKTHHVLMLYGEVGTESIRPLDVDPGNEPEETP